MCRSDTRSRLPLTDRGPTRGLVVSRRLRSGARVEQREVRTWPLAKLLGDRELSAAIERLPELQRQGVVPSYVVGAKRPTASLASTHGVATLAKCAIEYPLKPRLTRTPAGTITGEKDRAWGREVIPYA